MVLHQSIQRLLLIGAHIETLPPPAGVAAPPPRRLKPLIDAITPVHHASNERAVHFGHRYRSGFWAIYSLSALAVLCAVLPLALGWDSRGHALHPLAGLWAVAEVLVIAVVSVIYWRGHRGDWQGQWLHTRTSAEMIWYLPLLAPLVDFDSHVNDPNWYTRVFSSHEHPDGTDEVTRVCALNESLAQESLRAAWQDLDFVDGYARWAIATLEEQRRYHYRVAGKQDALLHRVHTLTAWLFGLTALGALTHLVMHSLWLSLITTFFPALGASLHGALAQSEAYRLSATAERLVSELKSAIDRIQAALQSASGAARIAAIKATIRDSLGLILEEHQDWQMLVRPHHLPLA
jgi:hypothetical protein